MAIERIKGDKGFLFYYDDQIFLEYLEPADFKTVVLSACVYAKTGDVSMPEDSSKESMMAFRMMASHIDRDKEKYAEISRKRAEAGSAGGLAKATNAKQGLANLAFATNDNQNKANLPDIDKEKEKDKEKDKEKEQIETESEWSVFLGTISDVVPESKLRNPEKCRDLLADRITETGLTASEIADCVKDFTHDYKSKGNDPMFFKQLERILGDAYGETIKTYVTKKAREKKKAQREEEKIDYLNLWGDDDSEDSIDFSAKLGEPWQSFKKVIDRGLIPETNVDLVNCTELLEKRCNAGYRAELLAVCINEHAEACRKHKLQIKPLAEILGGNLFNGTIAPMYRRKYGQLVTIPADSGDKEEAELPF